MVALLSVAGRVSEILAWLLLIMQRVTKGSRSARIDLTCRVYDSVVEVNEVR